MCEMIGVSAARRLNILQFVVLVWFSAVTLSRENSFPLMMRCFDIVKRWCSNVSFLSLNYFLCLYPNLTVRLALRVWSEMQSFLQNELLY